MIEEATRGLGSPAGLSGSGGWGLGGSLSQLNSGCNAGSVRARGQSSPQAG